MAYNEDSIKVYKGLKGIRKRPSMYIGQLGEHAILQVLKEGVENCLDEYLAGHNKYIVVKIEGEKKGFQTFTVGDKGRGIPTGIRNGKSILTTLMTTIHAGGKFDSKAYQHSRGLHGLGISATNALSSLFEIWTYRDGWYYQAFKSGKAVAKLKKVSVPSKMIKELKLSKRSGTIVKFTPDYKILGKANLSKKSLVSWLEDMANLNSKLTIKLIIGKKEKIFCNNLGPGGYLKHIISSKKFETLGEPFVLNHKKAVVAFQWADYDDNDGIMSYVNGGFTEGGGTHVKGLQDAIVKAFQDVAPKSKKQQWTPSDIRMGIIGFINYFTENPEFDSQTKSRLVSVKAKANIMSLVLPNIVKFLKKNKSTTKEILSRASEIKKAREQAKQITKAALAIGRNTRGTLLPGKLLPASNKTPAEEKELFLLEGDSAGGTAKNARDSAYQEVLPLRGKIINSAKTSTTKVFASKEVQSILAAIGINPKDNGSSKFRIGKILLLCDPDVDGRHISNLICTLLYSLVPEVFDKHMVYGIDAPLYLSIHKGKKYFGYTLKDIQSKVGNKTSVTRMKGWGETSWQVLSEIAFSEKRKIFKILPLSKKDKVKFYKLVGSDTTERKRLLGI